MRAVYWQPEMKWSSTGSKVHCMVFLRLGLSFCMYRRALIISIRFLNAIRLPSYCQQSGGEAMQWSWTDRPSDCVHEQVAKLDPVSRAAGMDCEYPLDKACHVHEKGDVL